VQNASFFIDYPILKTTSGWIMDWIASLDLDTRMMWGPLIHIHIHTPFLSRGWMDGWVDACRDAVMMILIPSFSFFSLFFHSDEREDMGGHGSFLSDSRTLYVGHVSPESSQEEVRRHFGEWGEIESAKVFAIRGFAFVAYKSRLCAEFAKEAMYGQSLDHGEILNIRWAKPDSNPRAAVVNEKRVWDEFEEKVDSIHQAREERRDKMRKMMEEEELTRQSEEEKKRINLVGYASSSDED
jgi:hypothetical protein